MDILRKEYCTRRGSALEAFRTRAKSRGRPVTSDRPRCMVLSEIASKGSCRAKLLKTIHLFVPCVSIEASPGSGPEVQRQPQNLVDVGFAPKFLVFSPYHPIFSQCRSRYVTGLCSFHPFPPRISFWNLQRPKRDPKTRAEI